MHPPRKRIYPRRQIYRSPAPDRPMWQIHWQNYQKSYSSLHTLSTILNLAECALLFSVNSFFSAVIGFFVIIFTKGLFPQIHTGISAGQTQPFSNLNN